MLNLGGGELVVIALMALLVLGPSRLPGAAKQIGKALAEFRRMSSGVQDDLREAMNVEGVRETMSQVRDVLDVPRTIRNEVASAISTVGATSLSGSSAGSSSPAPGSAASLEAAPNLLASTAIPAPDGVFVDDLPPMMTGTNVPPPGSSTADVEGVR